MMAICWDRGQASVVHNHADQKCWMTVPVGKLLGQNFAVEDIDESRRFCRLVESDTFELSDCLAAKVELEEPIHQILNLPEYNERRSACISIQNLSTAVSRIVAKPIPLKKSISVITASAANA